MVPCGPPAGRERENTMPRIALGGAAVLTLLMLPTIAAAGEYRGAEDYRPPSHRSAADDAPPEPLAEVITGAGPGAGPSDVKPKAPPPQKGLIVPAVQKETEDPAAPLEVIVKRAPWTAKAKTKPK